LPPRAFGRTAAAGRALSRHDARAQGLPPGRAVRCPGPHHPQGPPPRVPPAASGRGADHRPGHPRPGRGPPARPATGGPGPGVRGAERHLRRGGRPPRQRLRPRLLPNPARAMKRPLALALLSVLGGLLLGPPALARDPPVVVASKEFPESYILGEIMAQLLED